MNQWAKGRCLISFFTEQRTKGHGCVGVLKSRPLWADPAVYLRRKGIQTFWTKSYSRKNPNGVDISRQHMHQKRPGLFPGQTGQTGQVGTHLDASYPNSGSTQRGDPNCAVCAKSYTHLTPCSGHRAAITALDFCIVGKHASRAFQRTLYLGIWLRYKC